MLRANVGIRFTISRQGDEPGTTDFVKHSFGEVSGQILIFRSVSSDFVASSSIFSGSCRLEQAEKIISLVVLSYDLRWRSFKNQCTP